MGESAVPETRRAIREAVLREKAVERVNEILTLQMGPDFVLATVSADFVDAAPASEIEATVVAIEKEIIQAVPEVRRVFIEARAWRRGQYLDEEE